MDNIMTPIKKRRLRHQANLMQPASGGVNNGVSKKVVVAMATNNNRSNEKTIQEVGQVIIG